jgi:hypothetical protein
MSDIRKGFWFVAALVLLFAGNAVAGPNASAVGSLDLVAAGGAGNQTDDKVVTGTVSGNGTDIVLEIFAAPLAGSVIGGEIQFAIDPSIVRVKSGSLLAPAGLFALGTTDTSATIGGFPPGVSLTNGYYGTVTFTTQTDVTGQEFSIGVKSFVVVDGATTQTDALTNITPITLNRAVPVPTLAMSANVAVIPKGGQVQVTANLTNMAAGTPVDVSITTSGQTQVSVQGQTGLTFSITPTAATASFVVVATGSNGTAQVSASIGGAQLAGSPASIVFSEQVPVELSSFGGELLGKQVMLNWTTASQTNNAGWRVLRSTDGEAYEPVSELLSGAGTSDALLSYSFVDASLPAAEQVLYLLEQVDLDGTVSRSAPVAVYLGARFLLPTEFAINAFPNPFNPSTTVSYDLPEAAAVTVVVYDALGQEVRRLVSDQKEAGRYQVQWDARDNLGRSVGSGVYIAKIEAGTFTASQKMLLLK